MLLLTGILPKLKSDRARDTTHFYKGVKCAVCLDVTRAPVGPTAWALLPGPTAGPGPGLGTQGLSGVRATTLVPTSESKRWPALPAGDGEPSPNFALDLKGHSPSGLIGFSSLKLTVWVVKLACLPSQFKKRRLSCWLIPSWTAEPGVP